MKWEKLEGGDDIFYAVSTWNGYELWGGHRSISACMPDAKMYHLYKAGEHIYQAKTQKECKGYAEKMEEQAISK